MIKLSGLHDWLLKREPRERLIFFLIGFLFIYLVWYLFLLRPVLNQKLETEGLIEAQKSQATTLNSQIMVKQVNLKDIIFSQKLKQYKQLNVTIQTIQQQLNALKPMLVSKNDMTNLSRDILKAKSDTIFITALDKSPPVLWQPINVETTDLTNIITSDIYLYAISIQFRADYFSTIDFLKKLEQLPWHTYWDSIDYVVKDYPRANVVLKLHVLSNEKS